MSVVAPHDLLPRVRMRLPRSFVLALAALALAGCGDDPVAPDRPLSFASCTETPGYTPTAGWRVTCPPAMGMDSARLRAAGDQVNATMPTLRALAIARGGYIVFEGYRSGASAATPFEMRSITKAVMATAVGAAVQAGRLDSTGVRLRTIWPAILEGDADPRKQLLTVEHLLDLSAGFDMNSSGGSQGSYATWALTRPLVADPGTQWSYDEVLYHVLGELLEAREDVPAIVAIHDRLLEPLGIPGAANQWPVSPLGAPYGAGGLSLTLRQMLTVGELYRRDGAWDGRQILPPGWVASIRSRPAGAPADVVYWNRGWRQAMVGAHVAIFAVGYGGQYLIVIPSLDLVIAATADPYAPEGQFPRLIPFVRDFILPAVETVP